MVLFVGLAEFLFLNILFVTCFARDYVTGCTQWLLNPRMRRGVTVSKSKKIKLDSKDVLVLNNFTIMICGVNVLVFRYMNFNIIHVACGIFNRMT